MRAASLVARRAVVSSRGVRAAAPRQLAPWRCLTQTTAPGAQEKRDILKASVPHVASLGWCDDALAAGAQASAGHERAARDDRCGPHRCTGVL